jgi:Rrf2 family protein
MVYLCGKGVFVLTARQEIAEQADIPSHFLAKIARELARAGLIEIRQGAKGGFVLLEDPDNITMLQVVETIIGEIYLNDCVARSGSCRISNNCAVHRVWLEARDQLRETLAKVTFADLIRNGSCVPLSPRGHEIKKIS